MFRWLLSFFGKVQVTPQLDEFEPIYGLPRASFEEWISRNPTLRKEYEAKLMARSLGNYRLPER
jgi:hypothetical protein